MPEAIPYCPEFFLPLCLCLPKRHTDLADAQSLEVLHHAGDADKTLEALLELVALHLAAGQMREGHVEP